MKHFDGAFFFLEIDVPKVQALVGIGNFFAVGRPGGKVEIRAWSAEGNFLRLALATLILDVQSVFAGFIGK